MPRLAISSLLLAALALTGCQPTAGPTDAGPTAAADPTATGAPAEQATPTNVDAASQAPSSAGISAASQANSTGSESSAGGPSASAKPSPGGELLQVAGITDGDTIKVWINGKREPVRLLGVDTPESRKPNTAVACYAKEATSRMQSLVQSKTVRLVADPTQADRDRYGRLVRYVVLADGSDVSQLMIAGGFGREYTYAAAYAKQGSFRTAQSQAQAAKRGLWGACSYAAAFNPATTTPAAPPQFVQPSTSAARPTPRPTPTEQATGGCDIKGNISSSGEKIYHLPGQQHYGKTKITLSKGERWFCSEAEAQDAGWRRSKV